jgi:hypothetical protein
MPKRGTITFPATFAPGRKCVQADTDGEVLVQFVIPASDAPKLLAAFPLLKNEELRVTVGVA